jgi:hypothetical protein
MIPFMLFSVVMSNRIMRGPLPAGSYVGSICSYSFAAVALVTLGVGAIRARRWAWALNLILSWAGLILGVVATIGIAVFLPRAVMPALRQAAASAPDAPPISITVMAVILTVTIVFMSFFFVIVPLAFLLFFRRKDVEETCKRRDLVERWTDRSPLPVLAASLLFGSGAAYALLLAITTPLLPFFGRYLTGSPAVGILIVLAVSHGILAFGLYRLRLVAWWSAVGLLLLRTLSTLLTYRRGDLLAAYSKMGWSQGQLEVVSGNPAFRSGLAMTAWALAISLMFLGYMIWIKRYFNVVRPAHGAVVPDGNLAPPSDGVAV